MTEASMRINSETIQNNNLINKLNELIRHYDVEVAREREKLMKKLEEKFKNTKINKTIKPSAHTSFEKEFGNYEKSQSENLGNRNEGLNR